jgi:oligopeptidase A
LNQERQAELGQKYAEHVLDATDGFACYVSEPDLAGVPTDVVRAAESAAKAQGQDGYKLTLHFPSYYPVMQYGQNRALRERLYTAYVTRASEFGPDALDNSAVMGEMLALRQEEARLLGFDSYAELSLVPKMADTPTQVCAFLRDLGQRARASALRDLTQLREFARSELGLLELQSWDMTFAAERLKERLFAFSDQEVKQYLSLPKVLEGLFRIVETLFEVSIREDSAPVWHPSVRFFRIERTNSGQVRRQASICADGSAQLVGQFYLDLYARPGKRPGAWMDGMRDRWSRPEGCLQTPVANLVCNFAPPICVDGREQPALLTHDDLITLFHEFGHGLHHMLTQVDDIGVSGISGVEWDATELPSQLMENFCWE